MQGDPWRGLPEPGTGPSVVRAAIPIGTDLLGLAPMGIRWRAKMTASGPKPEGNCPRSEFVITHAAIGGMWKEVR
jgi:hypothetical protein